eukprot:gb/GEZN01009409.1/.p1 GENE.gb/GEZN01009409.1/~~gb/GEZN01009409.1/.p1  ORF type:complete len:396 (-),score=113.70 gb/GEZN01009409.1/:92-1279(-)
MVKKNSGARKKLEKEKASQPKPVKIKEDKTFGLKNKNKSKKVQEYVNLVKHQETEGGKSKAQKKTEEQREAEKAAKKAKAELDEQMASLFKAAVDTKNIDPNADPKSILCPHFKAGLCKFGKKCKHSHDITIERKGAKINLYVDPRQQELDTMDKWDQKKLEEVLAQKERGRVKENETKIVCKYFVEAIESFKYGWLWKCPNGVNCIYKHALPPGFVLKRDQVDDVETEVEILEEKIDAARALLDLQKCTPLTMERFQAWKAEKAKKREADVIEKVNQEKKNKSKGPGFTTLSGRDLFTYDPSVFVDDISAGGAEDYVIEREEEEIPPKSIAIEPEPSLELLSSNGDENDQKEKKKKKKKNKSANAPGPDPSIPTADAAPIDESLFMDDDDLPDE